MIKRLCDVTSCFHAASIDSGRYDELGYCSMYVCNIALSLPVSSASVHGARECTLVEFDPQLEVPHPHRGAEIYMTTAEASQIPIPR
jgi:hypothetical protein